jgi:hypothetical protein
MKTVNNKTVVWRLDSYTNRGDGSLPFQHLAHPAAAIKPALCGAMPWFDWTTPKGNEPKCSACQRFLSEPNAPGQTRLADNKKEV